MKRQTLRGCILAVLVLTSTWWIPNAEAIPAFARKYETSCTTCHYAFPKLNAFGKAFKHNGFRYPGDDAAFSKDEPVSMGSEAYKRVFPDAIWPSDIPGKSPFSLHLIGRIKASATPGGEEEEEEEAGEANLSFEMPHEAEILYGGTLGESLSFIGEFEWEEAEELGYGFSLQYNYKPYLHLKVGNVEPLPIEDGHRLTKEHYGYADFSVPGAKVETRLRKISGQGFEINGAGNGPGNKGGYTYKIGLINGQHNDENDDVNTAKDIYAHVTYKIGGLGELGGTEGQASETSAFWRDDSVRVGAFVYLGKSAFDEGENSTRVIGVDLDAWYDRFNLFGAFLIRNDDNPAGDNKENNAAAAFGELDVVVFPWLIGLARLEWLNANTDNADVAATATLIPAAVAMIRPNVRASVEARIPLDEASRDEDGIQFVSQINYGF